jgi:hypothetical protein
MFKTLLAWIGRADVERQRHPGESCESCCHFIDYRSEDDDPREANGYCGQLVDKLGIEEAIKVNPYGGYWTHSDSWCGDWEGGEPLWQTSEGD